MGMFSKEPKQSTAAERTAKAVLGTNGWLGHREVDASRRARDRAAELRRKGK